MSRGLGNRVEGTHTERIRDTDTQREGRREA